MQTPNVVFHDAGGDLRMDWYNTVVIDTKEDAGMKLYEYAVVYTGDADGVGAAIIAVDSLLADSEESARMKIARLIPSDWEDNLDDIDIHIRLWS